jgi:predicted PurR-regulated permease PerM
VKDFESPSTTRWGINFLALFGLVFALRYGRVMIIPVVISLMLTSALWPAVQHLKQFWKLPRVLSSMAVIGALVVFTGLVFLWGALALQSIFLKLPPPDQWLKGPPERELTLAEVQQIGFYLADQTLPLTAPGAIVPSYTYALVTPSAAIPPPVLGDRGALPRHRTPYQMIHDRVAEEISADLAKDLFPADPQKSFLYRNLVPVIEEHSRALPTYVGKAVEQTIFILFLVFFLLIEGEMLMQRTAEIFGPSTGPYSRAAIKALEDMATQVRAYLVWRTIINMGLIVVLGFVYEYLLGMTFPWVWAILAGILTYVPYIGPLLAFGPTAADALFSPNGGVWSLVAVTVIYAAILTAEGYIVFPLVIGRNMEMNATTVLLACLFWWLVWGEIGLFLAMPLMGGIKAICQNVPGWEPWANLMGMEAEGPSAGRRGRLRRITSMLLLGPLLPLTRALRLEDWARTNARLASRRTSPSADGAPADANGEPAGAEDKSAEEAPR